ncbi:hypothetical protein T439DRAFT_335418 [Meredithblackwellia eburnea MCA 4105]
MGALNHQVKLSSFAPRKSLPNNASWRTYDIVLLVLAVFLPFLSIVLIDGCRMPLFVDAVIWLVAGGTLSLLTSFCKSCALAFGAIGERGGTWPELTSAWYCFVQTDDHGHDEHHHSKDEESQHSSEDDHDHHHHSKEKASSEDDYDHKKKTDTDRSLGVGRRAERAEREYMELVKETRKKRAGQMRAEHEAAAYQFSEEEQDARAREYENGRVRRGRQ